MTGIPDDIAGRGEGSADGKTDVFLDAWRARWPEWSVAMAFVPAAQRTRVAAWGALQQALTDAAWTGDDPTPGLAKLAWWQEELAGWAKGARRHPLGALLQLQPAPWQVLSRALPRLQATRLRPGEAAPGDGAWREYAAALAACDTALFAPAQVMAADVPAEAGHGVAAPSVATAASAPVAAIATALRGEQALLSAAAGAGVGVGGGADARAGGDLDADAGVSGRRAASMASDATIRPASVLPSAACLARPRAIHAALVAARLQRPRAPLPAWRVPWLAWRAARNAR